MANKSFRIVKLVSEEGTGYYYTTTRPTRGVKASTKLRMKKYDPVLMKHCYFKEVKKLKWRSDEMKYLRLAAPYALKVYIVYSVCLDVVVISGIVWLIIRW